MDFDLLGNFDLTNNQKFNKRDNKENQPVSTQYSSFKFSADEIFKNPFDTVFIPQKQNTNPVSIPQKQNIPTQKITENNKETKFIKMDQQELDKQVQKELQTLQSLFQSIDNINYGFKKEHYQNVFDLQGTQEEQETYKKNQQRVQSLNEIYQYMSQQVFQIKIKMGVIQQVSQRLSIKLNQNNDVMKNDFNIQKEVILKGLDSMSVEVDKIVYAQLCENNPLQEIGKNLENNQNVKKFQVTAITNTAYEKEASLFDEFNNVMSQAIPNAIVETQNTIVYGFDQVANTFKGITGLWGEDEDV